MSVLCPLNPKPLKTESPKLNLKADTLHIKLRSSIPSLHSARQTSLKHRFARRMTRKLTRRMSGGGHPNTGSVQDFDLLPQPPLALFRAPSLLLPHSPHPSASALLFHSR